MSAAAGYVLWICRGRTVVVSMQNSVNPEQQSDFPHWLVLLCGLWIVAFLWVFFSQQLPNNPTIHRADVWNLLVDELLLGDTASVQQSVDQPPSGWAFLPQRLPHLLTGGCLLLAAWAIGQTLLQALQPRTALTRAERLVLAAGLGLSAQSLIILLAGLSGQLSRTCIVLPAVCCLPVWLWVRRGCAAAAADRPAPLPRQAVVPLPGRLLAAGILLPFTGYLLLGALSPQTDFDVREYHLQGPREWFQQGQITFLRHNVYTSFPFLTEMFCLGGMVLDGDWKRGALSGQLVLGCFAPLTCLSVYCLARRLAGSVCGLLAAVIHLTTPWTLRISLIAYAEGGLTFFLAAAALCSLIAWQESGQSRFCRRLLVITGLLAGSAMACKYTGLISVVIPAGLLALWSCWRGQRRDAVTVSGSAAEDGAAPAVVPRLRQLAGYGVLFGMAALLAVGPWLVRNYRDTGNPVYPLAWGLFGGREWSDAMDARWKPAHAPPEHRLTQIPQHVLDVAIRNDWTSGLLFALAVPAALQWRRVPGLGPLLGLLLWLFATWWALTHRIDRFWIPAIPLLSAAAALAWQLSAARWWRGYLLTVVAAVTLFNLRLGVSPLVGFHAGLMDLQAAEQLTVRADLRQLNQTLPAGARVLMVGEAEVFNAEFSVIYNTVFDDCIFEQWTAAASSASGMRSAVDIQQTFQEQQITHILVNWMEILRYRLPGSYGYTEYVQPSRLAWLVQQGVLERPVVLLPSAWSSLSPGQQQELNTWEGIEDLRPDAEVLSGVQLYRVRPMAPSQQ